MNTVEQMATADLRPLAERRRPKRIGPLDYTRRWWLRLTVAATFALLYAPIITLMAFSFNDSRRQGTCAWAFVPCRRRTLE